MNFLFRNFTEKDSMQKNLEPKSSKYHLKTIVMIIVSFEANQILC